MFCYKKILFNGLLVKISFWLIAYNLICFCYYVCVLGWGGDDMWTALLIVSSLMANGK